MPIKWLRHGRREKLERRLMSIRPASFALAPAVLALVMLALTSGADAQEARHEPSSQSTPAPQTPPAPSGQKAGQSSGHGIFVASGETRRLPEDSTTKHSITVNGRALAFTATAGSMRLFDEKESRRPTSSIRRTSWTAPIARSRPVTFFFNGGPGASSAYLQLGCAGPWRLSDRRRGRDRLRFA